jgi:glycosyltransferase involved in cell wall biosynthesis
MPRPGTDSNNGKSAVVGFSLVHTHPQHALSGNPDSSSPQRANETDHETSISMSAAGRGFGLLVVQLAVVGTVPSGGDRMALELARRWPDSGGPVTMLTTRQGVRTMHDLGIRNVNARVLSGSGVDSRAVSLAYLMRTLVSPFNVWRLMRGVRPRIALSATLYPPDVVGALVARGMGADWVHSWQLVIPPPGVGYELIGKPRNRRLSLRELAAVARHALSYASQNLSLLLARRWCNRLIVPTQLMASEAIKRGFRQDQIHVANYGIDNSEVEAAISSKASSVGPFDAVFLGQFRPQKGLDDLLAVWRLVQRALPKARLAVIGDGTSLTASQFKNQVKEFKDESVSLLGVISGPDKYAALSAASVFLFPSHHESWGLVALEAMAVGVPVVGFDIPSSREAFGDSMLLVPAYDVTAFANAVVHCLTHEEVRATYCQRGRRMAKKYDWDTIAAQFAKDVLG